MSISCAMFRASSLVAVALLVIGLTPVSAQTPDGQTRPRTLSSATQDLVPESEEAELQIGSPEANAEAKRLYKAGSRYGEAGLFAQAAELLQRAVRLKPDYKDAYCSLGHAYFDLQQWDKAVPTLEHALALSPKDKETRERLDQARFMLNTKKDGETIQPQRSASQESRNDAPLDTTTSPTKTSATDASLMRVYRVGPGDVLDVRFSDTPPTDSVALTITASGLLEHSSLGEPLPVAGLTVEEIKQRLESTMKSRATANSVIAVAVHEYVSHRILVSGLVKDPGTKILQREAIPLSVVVADAQPLPEAAQATVLRSETNESFTIDLAQVVEMSLLVRPGDVITLQVKPTEFFYVGGDVKAPGEKVFRRGLTLTQAIITAGGLTKNSKEARLARDDGKGFLAVTRYRLKDIEAGRLQDPLIQPGDRITVTH